MIIVPLSFKTPACVKDYINPTIQSVYSGYSFLILLFRFFYSDSSGCSVLLDLLSSVLILQETILTIQGTDLIFQGTGS